MKFEWRFFQSKVSRRIFFLFILSALVPVIFLIIFQLMYLSRSYNENESQQVRQAVKTIGMNLIGRLFHLQNQLNLLGSAIKALPPHQLTKNKSIWLKLSPDFIDLSLVQKNKKTINLKGKKLNLPDNTPSIPIGSEWVIVSEQESKQGHIILVYRVDKNSYLLGKVQGIWNFDARSDALFWVLGPNDKLIYANTKEAIPDLLIKNLTQKDTGAFKWKHSGLLHHVGYWKLFLKERLHSKDWVVVLAQPKSDLWFGKGGFYSIVLPTILIALFLTAFLSQAQIRRYLVPLEKLKKATSRIAKRDFTESVEVGSHDEFEELGNAFNSMTSHLQYQFKTLSILAALDKEILANKKGVEILNIIFKKLKEVANYDISVLGIFELEEERSCLLTIDSRAQQELIIEKAKVRIKDYNSLQRNTEIKINLSKTSMPSYLKRVECSDSNYWVIFPILHHAVPSAFIALGFHEESSMLNCNTEALHDIFSRASVAYSHAELEERLFYQAHYEDLTGLPNRLVLRDEMQSALKRASKKHTHCALLFVDLDNFKDINDTLGHSVGDVFLAKVANRMKEAMEGVGILARVGGDEFTILISDQPSAKACRMRATFAAKQLFNAFSEPFLLQKMDYFASASVGIAIYPDDSRNSDDLLKFADMSMYKAKELGRKNYVFFSKEIKRVVQERNHTIQELHMALQSNQLRIHFQPKIDSISCELVGAEALIRWEHPERGLLLPDAFLPLVEDSNLIFQIGEWVMENTCKQLSEWKKEGISVCPIAINIAAHQFNQKNLAGVAKRIIQSYGLEANILEFEVTENAFISNFVETTDILNQLKKLGARISLDDFGTGYSSMSYLRELPLDIIKIDRIFTQGFMKDKVNLSIIQAIITLAENLKLQLVAEGIELQEQSEHLKELGCVIQQGFYFSKPLPADIFSEKYLKRST